MASSMIAAAVAASTSASSAATGETKREEEDGCNEEGEEEALNTSLRSCANDPDFAVICAFLQKFAKDLGIPLPNFKHLQEWLTNTDEVTDQLRDLHIKLLRKTRKTVHEKSWESALSKFCFTYSAQDAWEVERFGYKKSSLKVKLRIFRELLESQFQRNGKFRAQILTMSADSLRSQPIGRDRLGHTYYFTQDADGNLRVYQEHLDEEIWQVVATTREELVNLISRLRGNEVVLPSTDIGVDEDTSSSNSCTAQVEKPPPPEEQDDSQEEEVRIPNLRIKLSNNGKLAVTSPNTTTTQTTKRSLDDVDKSSPRSEELNIIKKARPSLLDVNRAKKPSRYEKTKSEEEEEGEEDEDEEDDVDEEELSIEEEDIDSAAAEEDENEEKEIEDSDGDSDEENEVSEAIEEPTLVVRGAGAGEDCDGVNTNTFLLSTVFFDDVCDDAIVGDVVEEATLYICGEGSGAECLVGNDKNDVETATTTTTPTKANEPKATFFFGEPGCLKLSPLKQQPKDKGKKADVAVENSQAIDKKSEIVEDATNDKAEDLPEDQKDAKDISKDCEQANNTDLSKEDAENSTKDQETPDKKDLVAKVTANGDDVECGKNILEKNTGEEQEKCAENNKEKVNEKEVAINDDAKNKVESVEKLETNKDEVIENSINENKVEEKTVESGVKDPQKQETLKSNSLNHKQNANKDVNSELSEKIIKNETSDKASISEPKKAEIHRKVEVKDIEVPKSAQDNQDNTATLDVVVEKVATNVSATDLSNENGEGKETLEIEKTKNEEQTKSAVVLITESSENAEAKNLTTKTNISSENPKTDLENVKINPLTATKSISNDVTNDVSPTNTSPSTTSTPHTTINRKRRLEDMPAPATHRLSTSESEVDIHSEQQEELATEDDLDPTDVGGKRFKMRPKITNTDIRKKVEAQKGRVDETTSSSGEEDARRRRKIITPRRQIERCVKNLKVAHEAAAKRESSQAQTSKQAENTIAGVGEEKCEALNLTSPTTTLAFPPVFPTVATTTTTQMPFLSATTPLIQMPPPAPTAPLTSAQTTPTTPTGRQKPTLAEIIEKKLKKSCEKAATTVEVETPPTPPAIAATTTIAIAATTTSTNDVSSTLATFSPPKKSPITKPLKKNLLTQLRQEESDEDSIPRKRTISDAGSTETAKKLEIHSGEEKEPTPERKMPERKTPERKASEATFNERATVSRKTPDRKTPERQRKRRSSEEVKVTGANESESNKEMKYETLVEYEAKTEVVVKKEKSPSPAEAAVVGRRSSRRSAATVIYAELPQPKRTRGGAKATTPIATPKKAANIKEDKSSEVAKEVSKAVVEAVSADDSNAATSNTEITAESIYQETVEITTIKETTKKAGSTAKESSKEAKAKAKPTKATKATKKDAKKEAATIVKEEPKPKPEKKAAATNASDVKNASTTAPSTSTTPEKAEKPVLVKSTPTPSPTKTPTPEKNSSENTSATARGRGPRKQREVDATNIIETIDSETPVRQSRRIAQQKIREEAERRKLEEIALRTMKQELKKKKKAEKQVDPTVAEPSEPSSSEESEVELKKKAKKKCPGKDGWSSGSEEQEEPEEEDEPPQYSDPGSPLFRSDHEFSPESDLEDETQVVPMKRARTARKEDAEEGEDGDEEACQKCGKSDHPEWILLCDKCDKGYHCSCLSPVLFYIPEGDWYCPPCQQEQLIAALERQLNDFDEFVELKRLQEVENKRLAAEAERAEQERLENEKQQQKELKERKKHKKKSKRRGENGKDGENGEEESGSSGSTDDDKSEERNKKRSASQSDDDDSEDDKPLVKKGTGNRKSRTENYRDSHKRRRGDGRSRRRAARRGIASRRRQRNDTDSGTGSGSAHRSGSDSGDTRSGSGSSSSSSVTDSDDEPIYKLRKRRQINVSYRLNEYDDLINSALKKEMDELAGAGNLGRGKDISTIMEADKEEKARQRQVEQDETADKDEKDEKTAIKTEEQDAENEKENDTEKQTIEERIAKSDDDDSDEVLKRKAKPKCSTKKKSRKLTTLDISSEEDNASDEDFKTSSFDDDEEEDTSISVSTDSDSSLEVFRRRGKKNKKQRKAARRATRERRKDRRFVVDESDDEEEEDRPKSKKKKSEDLDYTESETDSEASENLEDVDSADLCDDTTSESDGAWYPSKRKKQRKGNSSNIARKSPKLKKQPVKKVKRVEYSDDDISESEEEEDEDDDITGGKGSGKQPRSQPLKSSNSTKGKGKGKGKGKTTASKKKKKVSEDEDSFSDSDDSTRRTRGRRYAYLEDFDDESSDGGIKPGVKRPDTPPEERQKFIQRQEEIKRMLAEKNAEGAKLAATPRLTPIKADGDKDKRSPAKLSDSLSTVPLSVIRQAKALDAEYLQRKGESIGDSDNVDEVDEFDDADLPDDFPEDMDEDTIARMVEEEEELSAAAAARELPPADEVLRTPTKQTNKSKETSVAPTAPPAVVPAPPANLPSNASSVVVSAPGGPDKTSLINPALAALAQMPGASSALAAHHMSSPLASGLQEPMRKRLPMPTLHPPLLRHQFPPHGANMPLAHLLQRHPSAQPPTHLLQSALNAPLGQPLNRSSFPPQHLPRLPAGMTVEQMLAAQHLMTAAAARHNLPPSSQPLPGAPNARDVIDTSGSAGSGPGLPGATASSVPPAPAVPINKPETEPKPRGRRKKITPLRDTLQKQQTAAAVTAATTQSDKPAEPPASNGAGGGSVIKSALSASVNAPPPQLYKQQEGAGAPIVSAAAIVSQASVITRMPQLPTAAAHASVVRAMSNLYPGADVARFFAPPTSLAAVTGARPAPPSMQRHRDGPSMQGLSPHGMRQSYGPPPPLRGSGSSLTNHGPPPQGVVGERPTYPAPGDHHVPGGMGASMYAGPPPPARHSTSHLNPYRPPIYGNPSFVPRGPHVPNIRVPVSGGPEFPSGPSTYSPYGYYPPPPPLTTPHGPPMQRPPTSSPAPISRGPPPTTAATASVPPIPPTIVASTATSAAPITTTPIATTKTSIPASAITTTIAKPSSVIVAAPPSSASTNLNASAARNIVQKSSLPTPTPTPTIIQPPTPIPPTTPASVPPPAAIPTRAIVTEAAVSAPVATIVNSKGPIVTATVAASVVSEPQAPPRKKLTTLETYAVAQTKSPLVIAGESSGSRSSPGGIQAEPADDSSSAQGAATTAAVADSGEGQASEFSGLVSYFSSQHDDYNT
ncbi:uncharacterized protein LOC105212455 [Zeugodacus cucurbitae]|uniref:uncharacterized protein LOC105212455 n=1 Tax=Zeugodacus cucurbitae TaxID=28588 RepID=UPI0023D94137|nr:uncharacterized protein LOC105212455 [Zeugodacus cucurbitae]